MWFWKVLQVALCPAVLCQAHRLIKKPARTGWVYIVVSGQAEAHMWSAFTSAGGSPHHHSLETGMARMQPILQNLCYSSVYGNETLTTNAKPHACFIYNRFQTPRASLSYAENQHAQSIPTRPTNQQCMTAPESCSLRMPACVIVASPFTKADCQRPAFDICLGLVTRNVGIIHISLTGL